MQIPEQIVVTGRIRRGTLDPDLCPVGVELLGKQGRQPGVGTLAHLQVLGDHGHGVVGTDTQKGVRFEQHLADRAVAGLPRAGLGGGRGDAGQAQAQRQSRAGLEKMSTTQVRNDVPVDRGGVTRVGHGGPPQASVLAASWIAARIRR